LISRSRFQLPPFVSSGVVSSQPILRGTSDPELARLTPVTMAPLTVNRSAPRNLLRPLHERHQHGHTTAIALIFGMLGDQVALLELDRNENVGGRDDREHQGAQPSWSASPECEEPADVQRVTHVAVQRRHPERHGLVRLAQQLQPNLAQTEQVKVIDQERRKQEQSPTEGECAVEHGCPIGEVTVQTTPPIAARMQRGRLTPGWRAACRCCAQQKLARCGSTSA